MQRASRVTDRPRRIMVAAWFVVACLASTVASAQPLPSDAQDLLDRARDVAAEALERYERHFPDQPLWREALDAGREAARLAPAHPAPRRFLAEAYATVQWSSRAWDEWQAYRDAGGEMDDEARGQVVTLARSLGVQAFDAGRREDALPYLSIVVAHVPDDLAANARLARWHAERGEYDLALPYLDVVDAAAGDAFEAFVLDVRRRARHGDAAVDAYDAGRVAQDDGRLERALDLYRTAVGAAAGFTEAWRSLAELALSLERFDVSASAFEAVLAATPDDEGAREAYARALIGLGVPPPADDADVDLDAAAPPGGAVTPPDASTPVAPAPAAPAPAPVAPAPAAPAPPTEAALPAANAGVVVAIEARLDQRRTGQSGSGAFTFVDAPALARDLSAYASGALHVEIEVLDAPSESPVQYQVCLVPFDIGVAPACSDPQRLVVVAGGRATSNQPVASLFGSDRVDWRAGIASVMLVARDERGTPLDQHALTAAGERRTIDLERYYPRSLVVRAALVPAGTTFTLW